MDAALATAKLTAEDLSYALEEAEKDGATDIAARLRKVGAVPPPKADFAVEPATSRATPAATGKEGAGAAPLTLELSSPTARCRARRGGPPRKLAAIDALRSASAGPRRDRR